MSFLSRVGDFFFGDSDSDSVKKSELKREIKIGEVLGEDTTEAERELRKLNRRYTSDTGPR